MSKKERNTLTRIERENTTRVKPSRLYVKSLEEIPGELIEHVEGDAANLLI